MRLPWQRKPDPEPDPAPAPEQAANFRDDARIYALRGDNMWGHSITWQSAPCKDGNDENTGRIVGWLSQKPRPGDILAVAMVSGKWGKWLIKSVKPCRDPADMFFAEVWGAFDYIDDADVPATAYNGNGLTGAAADYV